MGISIMEKHRNSGNGNIDNIKLVEQPVKVYKWCWTCGKQLPEGSTSAFCDFGCLSAYGAELRKESEACFREWRGKD